MNKLSRGDLAATVASKMLVSGISRKFSRQLAAYLLSENRLNELQPLLRDIEKIWSNNGHLNALALTAHPLESQALAQVKRTLAKAFPDAKHIIVSEGHDQNILGGVRIEMSDSMLDLSLSAKLNKFKQLTEVEG